MVQQVGSSSLPVTQSLEGRLCRIATVRSIQQFRDVLVHAIPTEILAAYTALVGVVVGAVSADAPRHSLVPRWSLLGAFLVLTAVSVVLAYFFRAGRSLPRVPWQEALAATIAATAWFPGHARVTAGSAVARFGASRPLRAAITVMGGLALTLAAPLLRIGAATPDQPGNAVPQAA